jgi:hypothetical protein
LSRDGDGLYLLIANGAPDLAQGTKAERERKYMETIRSFPETFDPQLLDGAGQSRQKSRLVFRGAPTAEDEIHSEMVRRAGGPCSIRRMTINRGTSM